jgi:hypothetical protein
VSSLERAAPASSQEPTKKLGASLTKDYSPSCLVVEFSEVHKQDRA